MSSSEGADGAGGRQIYRQRASSHWRPRGSGRADALDQTDAAVVWTVLPGARAGQVVLPDDGHAPPQITVILPTDLNVPLFQRVSADWISAVVTVQSHPGSSP